MAETSIFSKEPTILNGVRKMDATCIKLTVNGEKSDSMVVQQAQLQATRQPKIVWEIGSNNFYKIDARPSGTAVLQNVVGPTAASLANMTALGNICEENNVTLTWKGSSECYKWEGASGTIKLIGGILTMVQFVQQAGDVTTQGQWQLIFADMLQGEEGD